MINPGKVLELGTFTGYSALSIAEGLGEDAVIHTIECDDELEDEIRANLCASPYNDRVKLHIGDALDIMKNFDDNEFELIVIDADKRQYPHYLKEAMRLLTPGGFIIADNTLWDGHVTETGKHSSQTTGILEFNDMAAANPELDVAIIPIRDGLTLIRKKPDCILKPGENKR